MPLTAFAVDEGPHSMDGLLLHAWEGPQRVEAFISRRVMDNWVDPREPYRGRRSLLRSQYDALGRAARHRAPVGAMKIRFRSRRSECF